MGKLFKGVFHLINNSVHLYDPNHKGKIQQGEMIKGLDNSRLDELLDDQAQEFT